MNKMTMTIPPVYSFTRYLSAKKSVDDRSLNRGVWQTLAGQLLPVSPAAPLQVLEVGAGIGTMLERMLDWGLLTFVEYTAIDAQQENIAHAHQRLPRWAAKHGFQVEGNQLEGWLLTRPGQQAAVRFESVNLFDFAARPQNQGRWDLLVAHAFLDLMNVPAGLPILFNLLQKNGLYYFTINFDGATLLEPAIDPVLDELIQSLYHETMDQRLTDGKPSGDSRAGRHLFTHLMQANAGILDAGASDWVVFPTSTGYPQDEAYFLHFILHTIYQALAGHPRLDLSRFEDWISERHAQVDRCELLYIAHQVDYVGRA